MSEENTSSTVQVDLLPRSQNGSGSTQSLLSIVHDKNKTIEKLQRQLHFQKLQLKYYLSKTMNTNRMLEFSRTCSSQAIEEHLPLTLAVNQFYKQMGIKSKITNLYDTMCNIDTRINNLLLIQENFLKKIVGDVCDVVKERNHTDVQLFFRKVIMHPEYIDVFNNLLIASMGLRKNLDTFRICCDRLIIIEEERNMIVEQVYSLPVEERTNCNYLVGIQLEKVKLQNRLKQILEDQTILRKRIEELTSVEIQLRKLQEDFKASYRYNTEHITRMLAKVNSEASTLIAKSNQRRDKYTKEIVQLKSENMKISKLLEHLKVSINGKTMSRDSLKLDAVYSAGLFQGLDKEITQVIQENEMNKDFVVKKVKSECRQLAQELKKAQNYLNIREQELVMLRTEYEDAKRQWEHDLATAQRERDDYKAQVEDLEAIRSAYAQLVESRSEIMDDVGKPRLEQSEIQNEDAKIADLIQKNAKLSIKISKLEEEAKDQKSKIVRLSGMILNMNGSDQKDAVLRLLKTKAAGDVDIEEDGKSSDLKTCGLCQKKSELEKGIIMKELEKSNVSTEDLAMLAKSEDLDQLTINIIQDLSNNSNKCFCSSLSDSGYQSSNAQPSQEKKVIELLPCKTEETKSIISDNIDATFEINLGKRNSLEDILKGRHKLGGKLIIGDNPMLSVTLKRLSVKENKKAYVRSESNEQVAENNEYELLKDCSLETIPDMVNPVKKWKPYEYQTSKMDKMGQNYKKKDSKSIKITYRNEKHCLTTTDSDRTATDSQ